MTKLADEIDALWKAGRARREKEYADKIENMHRLRALRLAAEGKAAEPPKPVSQPQPDLGAAINLDEIMRADEELMNRRYEDEHFDLAVLAARDPILLADVQREMAQDADLDRIIRTTKVVANAPDAEAQASLRRSLVFRHKNAIPAIGTTPEDFVPPETVEDHAPDPQAATGYAVNTVVRRVPTPKLKPPTRSSAPAPAPKAKVRPTGVIHRKATIWDAIRR